MPGAGGTQVWAVGTWHFPGAVLQAGLHFGGDTTGGQLYSSLMREMSRGDSEVFARGRPVLPLSIRVGPNPLLNSILV